MASKLITHTYVLKKIISIGGKVFPTRFLNTNWVLFFFTYSVFKDIGNTNQKIQICSISQKLLGDLFIRILFVYKMNIILHFWFGLKNYICLMAQWKCYRLFHIFCNTKYQYCIINHKPILEKLISFIFNHRIFFYKRINNLKDWFYFSKWRIKHIVSYNKTAFRL